ncbi:MAG: nitroreductase family protein [Minwuia sp.]|uniref:nitroreductase family protein n=1 Tax=Minwuia sp. TaxID=2493630 RepID=UPI003A8A9BF1
MDQDFREQLERRFGTAPAGGDRTDIPDLWRGLAGRGSCRRFEAAPVDAGLIETICALALASPSKSDLQQRDIVFIDEPALRASLDGLLTPGQPWIAGAPHLLVVLGNNRRQRQIHAMRGHPFANDHLDAFFNAAVDAGIALSALVLAAEAAGLGACPISAIRNHAAELSRLLDLPPHVFPVAGLALGRPVREPMITPRLSLDLTVHRNRYDDAAQEDGIDAYDRRRDEIMPYRAQRDPARFGVAETYGWSEDKARQYAVPERDDFGDHVRAIGFRLD